MTRLCQFAGVVTEVSDTAADSQSQQQVHTAPDPSLGMPAPQLQVGDHVLGACRFGSYTTCLNVPAQQVPLTINHFQNLLCLLHHCTGHCVFETDVLLAQSVCMPCSRLVTG